ncbi:MAG: hypothetical protein N2319_08890 [Candidatus Kapabacteria bacterium]|nr:hypothetical protein [Candidatus Kapabacteria bacterium]
MLPPPENFEYNPVTDTLSWESIPDAEEYQIEYAVGESENWLFQYQGPLTSCPFGHPSGTYRVRGRVYWESSWSKPGKPKRIVVP